MYIKRGRLTKAMPGAMGCVDITLRYRFTGDYSMHERGGESYIKCFSNVVLKHDNIDGEIHLKKGTYKYEL